MSYVPGGRKSNATFADAVDNWINKANIWATQNGEETREMSADVLKIGERVNANDASITASMWAAWMRDTVIKNFDERVVVYAPNAVFSRYQYQYFDYILGKLYDKPVSFQVSK